MKKITFLLVTLFITTTTFATTLYLKPNANWKKDNARFAAYFFGNGEKWLDMTLTANETDIYQVEAPDGFPNVIFCRMNPSAKGNNWNNKWNQTADLKVPTNANTLYTVTENTWDKGGGTWSKYALKGEPNVKFNNPFSAKKGDTFIPNITCENIENPTYTYTVSYNGGEKIEFPATGYLITDYGKYEFTVEVKTNGTGEVIAFATIEVRVAYDAYIAGTHNGWNQDNDNHGMISDGNGILVKTYNQVAEGFTFKIVYKGEWIGFDKVNTDESIYCEADEDKDNIKFTLNEISDVTISYNPNAEKPITIKAEPILVTLFPENTTIYVTVHSQWTADNARFATYFFNNNENIWIDMFNIKENIYSVIVPKGEWKAAIFCRMNPNNLENRWNNEGEENGPFWGAQTKEVIYEEGKNHYIINNIDNPWNGNKPDGFWDIYESNNTPTTLENTTITNIYTQNGTIIANEEISIFSITGQNVTNLNGNLKNGVYIVKSANTNTKVVIK